MQQHAHFGARILEKATNDLIGVARDIALGHHERWDGQGYPNGLAGEAIPLCARIVAVADVFDALVSKRCYKPPSPLDKALAILREEKGKHFDPAVIDALEAVLEDVLACYEDL